MTTLNPIADLNESPAGHANDRLRRGGLWPYLLAMGPGLIAANAGNDAGGIATYASAGASYGYAFLWVMLVILLCLGVVQEMCARLGAVTGKGFADLVRENFSLRMTAFILLALLLANFGVIVTEFVGIGAAAELFGISRHIAIPVSAILLWVLITRGSYDRVEKIFLVLTLVFLAYIGAAFLAKPDWHAVLRDTTHPAIINDPGYLTMLIALIGTTITPYMQLYVTSSVAEKGIRPEDYRFTRAEVWVGTFFAVAISGFIIIATAATLFPIHKEVETAADAAMALAPLAGEYASYLFAIGLLGACLLAGGVLPLSTTYVMSEAAGFERGVSRSWGEAPIFIGMFTALLALGAAIAMIPGLPVIPVLLGVQVVNGLLLPIELLAILRLINNRELMGRHVNGRVYNLLAWTIAAGVSLLSLALIVITVLGWFGVQLIG
ncbi:MAG TPA: Nramp family divalent metal transporter [Accumulibacter sp.]|nr:Nramp family divalent metal transporter [Accumulibacter sp.]HMW19060.1 Nramp family divalent metal transporter [Accumulibacter sp.]HMX23067.1 Nramp family divalent metal transporter [Accumulibacter sp.]HMY06585.1 Nramp family divalent metal transporter [Accumulibacter sp.]HNC19046.1 Nramp family divalent metal transporter [Accumulibacter sp.]